MRTVLPGVIFALAAVPLALPAQVTRRTHGDTTFILTKGNGAWGAPWTAVELLRIGGGKTHETTLGDPGAITALPDGGMILFDRNSLDGPIVRMFDANGKFLRNIGRVGSGPGEYRSGIDIEVSSDGRIWLTDIANSRINIYSPTGVYLSTFRIPGYMWTIDMLRLGQRGDVYIIVPIFPPKGAPVGTRETRGYFRIDTLGRIVDTIRIPTALAKDGDDPFRVTILAGGQLVLAASDRFAFSVASGQGQHGTIVSSRDLQPIRYSANERRQVDSVRREITKQGGMREGNGGPAKFPELPEFKQPYSLVKVDPDGRIWFQRSVADDGSRSGANTLNPTVFNAFQPDGTFLGEVAFPGRPSALFLSFAGDFAWAKVTGEDEEVYLVKYRIR